MCYQESQMYLSLEEAAVAEESFSVYCKHVEMYNIIHLRASKHPLFLQKSLSYKIQEKRQRAHGVLDDGKSIVFKRPSNFNSLNPVTRLQVIISA